MSQLLHLVFEVNEEGVREIVHMGSDEASVKLASYQDQNAGTVRLYEAIRVPELTKLISNNLELLVAKAGTLIL